MPVRLYMWQNRSNTRKEIEILPQNQLAMWQCVTFFHILTPSGIYKTAVLHYIMYWTCLPIVKYSFELVTIMLSW